MTIIEDGQTGTVANVKAKGEINRLQTQAFTTPTVEDGANQGNTYGTAIGPLTLTTNQCQFIYIKNNETAKHLHVDIVSPGWNGGSTNFNRTTQFFAHKNPTAPSANNTTSSSGNLNFASAKSFTGDIQVWDGVGDGMTIATAPIALRATLAQGVQVFNINGAVIVSPGNSISFSFTASEVGDATITVRFRLEDT